MKASEAKKITKNAMAKKPEIGHLMDVVYGKIREAANLGKSCWAGDPFDGLRMLRPTSEQIGMVRGQLIVDGYTLGTLLPPHGPLFAISWPST